MLLNIKVDKFTKNYLCFTKILLNIELMQKDYKTFYYIIIRYFFYNNSRLVSSYTFIFRHFLVLSFYLLIFTNSINLK